METTWFVRQIPPLPIPEPRNSVNFCHFLGSDILARMHFLRQAGTTDVNQYDTSGTLPNASFLGSSMIGAALHPYHYGNTNLHGSLQKQSDHFCQQALDEHSHAVACANTQNSSLKPARRITPRGARTTVLQFLSKLVPTLCNTLPPPRSPLY